MRSPKFNLRRKKWEEKVGWDDSNLDRIVKSTEVLPEDLQDFTIPMVLIGGDVVSLYPNMKKNEVSARVKEAILMSSIKWSEVDYLEGVRYIALNLSAEECLTSGLRRVVPYRRKTPGSRPGIRGAGPRGKTRGNQEQWVFPEIVLSEEEKREIVAMVVSLATKAMFDLHHYQFGGTTFKQTDGGPIGLRGTCAIARIAMQIFDIKWKKILNRCNLTTWLIKRYMDDLTCLLPPIRKGWRWSEGEVVYCKRWELEDANLTPTEVTRRVLMGSMQVVEDYLKFTTETGDDFEDGWLPTLDVALSVDHTNRVNFRFFEKKTTTIRTVQKATAMNENSKQQVVSNDLIRRLLNTSQNMGATEFRKVVDQYGHKLLNSGYDLNQTRKILIAGIKGYEEKIIRCGQENRKLRRTAKESQGARTRRQLLSKTTWFKGNGRRKDWYKGGRKGAKLQGGLDTRNTDMEPTTVLFIDYSKGGEPARRMKDLMTRISKTIGFTIKVVERTGRSLKEQFPLTTLWDGAGCGRDECITCSQGAEMIPPCTQRSVV